MSETTEQTSTVGIAAGDLFVVARGHLFRANRPFMADGFIGSGSDEPREDRSWAGVVFKAECVCGLAVAARIVHANGYGAKEKIGVGVVLNLAELRVSLVTGEFLDCLRARWEGGSKVVLDLVASMSTLIEWIRDTSETVDGDNAGRLLVILRQAEAAMLNANGGGAA